MPGTQGELSNCEVGHGRALCKGLVFDREGKLIATTMHEGFLR